MRKYAHQWDRLRAADPEHSARFAERWRLLREAGHDLDGEARFMSTLAGPGSTVLDAGCGTGRVGGYLADRGYTVVGVDLDETLIERAREEFPQAEWHAGDLAEFDGSLVRSVAMPAAGGPGFDLAVCAGNVMTFLDPSSRVPALSRIAAMLGDAGRLVVGYGAGRGYPFEEFFADLGAAGIGVQHRFATWQLDPFTDDADFLVCIVTRAVRGGE